MRTKNGVYTDLIERLVPLAEELLRTSPDGVTVSELRVEGIRRGLIKPEERNHRALSALGQVFRRCKAVGVYERCSTLPSTHGAVQVVWYPGVS